MWGTGGDLKDLPQLSDIGLRDVPWAEPDDQRTRRVNRGRFGWKLLLVALSVTGSLLASSLPVLAGSSGIQFSLIDSHLGTTCGSVNAEGDCTQLKSVKIFRVRAKNNRTARVDLSCLFVGWRKDTRENRWMETDRRRYSFGRIAPGGRSTIEVQMPQRTRTISIPRCST